MNKKKSDETVCPWNEMCPGNKGRKNETFLEPTNWKWIHQTMTGTEGRHFTLKACDAQTGHSFTSVATILFRKGTHLVYFLYTINKKVGFLH